MNESSPFLSHELIRIIIVYLHVLADTLGSVGVIVSSILIDYKQWYMSDPICSVLISVLIGWSTLPLLKQTALQLVQRVPVELDSVLPRRLMEIEQLSPVLCVQESHFWKHSGTTVVGTLHLAIDQSCANDQTLLDQVSGILKKDGIITNLTVQFEKRRAPGVHTNHHVNHQSDFHHTNEHSHYPTTNTHAHHQGKTCSHHNHQTNDHAHHHPTNNYSNNLNIVYPVSIKNSGPPTPSVCGHHHH